ncbi:hypothetical protein AGDE_17203 [Angomonas deanei]|nr:hypothetical protein AGDE_17203 [Angomonas deanei]|eukprot:EPY15058.1 hypothetical protein AGDE_17203 [Angomonas deanei]
MHLHPALSVRLFDPHCATFRFANDKRAATCTFHRGGGAVRVGRVREAHGGTAAAAGVVPVNRTVHPLIHLDELGELSSQVIHIGGLIFAEQMIHDVKVFLAELQKRVEAVRVVGVPCILEKCVHILGDFLFRHRFGIIFKCFHGKRNLKLLHEVIWETHQPVGGDLSVVHHTHILFHALFQHASDAVELVNHVVPLSLNDRSILVHLHERAVRGGRVDRVMLLFTVDLLQLLHDGIQGKVEGVGQHGTDRFVKTVTPLRTY